MSLFIFSPHQVGTEISRNGAFSYCCKEIRKNNSRLSDGETVFLPELTFDFDFPRNLSTMNKSIGWIWTLILLQPNIDMNSLNLSSKYECLKCIFRFNNAVESCDPFFFFFSFTVLEQIDSIDCHSLVVVKYVYLSWKAHRQRSHTRYFQSALQLSYETIS